MPELPVMNKEIYIGDGVYASSDGWCIWLSTTRSQQGYDSRIALDPEVYQSLAQWIASFPRLASHMNGVRDDKEGL